MVEPLTLQIYRIKNGQRSSVPLPIGESGEAGVGWTRGEVLSIDQGWLVSWAGGGFYEMTVTDSTAPSPQKLVWTNFWPLPEKMPPTLAEAAGAISSGVVTPSPTEFQPQVSTTMQFPNGLPSGGIMSVPTALPAPQQQHYYVSQPQQQQQPYYAQQAYQAEAERRRLEERLAAMEGQLRQAQLDAAQRQHQVDLERERAANQAALQRLEQRLAEVHATPKSDDTVKRLEMQLDNERREREAERRERELKEQLLAMNNAVQIQIQQLQQNNATILQQAQNKGPDPMYQLMIEQNRQQMEAMKEIARQSNDGLRQMQTMMMNPRDVMAMTKEASNGIDGVTQKMSGIFGAALEMQQKVLENALQINQGGNETIGLIRDGIGSAQSMLERYVTSKSREAQVASQSQAAAAQAQAQAAAVQAQAQASIANAQARAAQPPPPQIQAKPQAGLAGANGTNGKAQTSAAALDEWRKQRELQEVAAERAANPTPRETVAQAPTPVPVAGIVRHGRTDEEWFGPSLPDVLNTRIAVKQFISDLARGVIAKDAPTPQLVAQGTMQAIAFVQAQGVPIPAIVELLLEGKVDEFMEVFLPDAPQNYRDDVAGLLAKALGMEDDEPEDDDVIDVDSGDDDGEHHDDVRDGHVDTKPRAQARA